MKRVTKRIASSCAAQLARRRNRRRRSWPEGVSNLKSEEQIVFIATDAWLSHDEQTWNVPVHAWVYEIDRAIVRRKAFATALRVRYGLAPSPATLANFQRRTGLILAGNERGKRIVVQLAGQTLTLPETGPDGHARAEFQIDAETVQQYAHDDQLHFSAVLDEGDLRVFRGHANLVSPQGLSVVSDFDDTVKVTRTDDRKRMFDYTFLRDFEAVEGMPEIYNAWASEGANFHFASSSPWHFYEPYNEFMDACGFPRRSMRLKGFRFRDKSLLNLFKKGTQTKPAQILPLLHAYPQRRFVLVGDSAQHDPEVYADLARQFPSQVERVFIRNVTAASAQDERFRQVFSGIDREKWTLFEQASELRLA